MTLAGTQFKFAQHGQSGQQMSELLPHLATVADDIAIVKTLHTEEINHAPAQMFLHTGFGRGGRPSFGSWVVYGLGSENQRPAGLRRDALRPARRRGHSLWSQRLPAERLSGHSVPLQRRPGAVPLQSQGAHAATTAAACSMPSQELNQAQLADVGDPEIATRISQYEMAFRMQTSVPELMDISQESADDARAVRRRAGQGLVRQQLPAGPPAGRARRAAGRSSTTPTGTITTTCKTRLPAKCKDVDQAMAALIKDLKQRGLLDDTLVIWGGEFGRTPLRQGISGDGATTKPGRDHHKDAYTMWLAGGGVKGGITLRQDRRLRLQRRREPGPRPRPQRHRAAPAWASTTSG